MPQPLTTIQLQVAQTMIANDNVMDFHYYIAGKGYGYANLALGVV